MLVTNDPFLAEFDRLAQQVFGGGADGVGMPVDVIRRGENLLVRVDVPGVPRESIGLNLDDHVLTISAERHAEHADGDTVLAQERFDGAMTRRLRVPDWIDAEKVTAEYADGVLSITLPMAEKARPRQIAIAAAAPGVAAVGQ
jgi:HSP20 family protein